MSQVKNAYLNCDELEKIPVLNKQNWLFEIGWLKNNLKSDATVLQVGSMDGVRAINILKVRPDLKITGLEIESNFVELAKKRVASAGLNAEFIHGDITAPPALPRFDYCICLNNTLGYILNQVDAIEGMKKLGKSIVISVYGEKFDDNLAREYFESIGLKIESIKDNIINLINFGSVKRYTKKEIEGWGGKINVSPIGYIIKM